MRIRCPHENARVAFSDFFTLWPGFKKVCLQDPRGRSAKTIQNMCVSMWMERGRGKTSIVGHDHWRLFSPCEAAGFILPAFELWAREGGEPIGVLSNNWQLPVWFSNSGVYFTERRSKKDTEGFSQWKWWFCSHLDWLWYKFDLPIGSTGGWAFLLLIWLVGVQLWSSLMFEVHFQAVSTEDVPDGSVLQISWHIRLVFSRS